MSALLPIPARQVTNAWELLETAARDAFGAHLVCGTRTYAELAREAARVGALFSRDGLAPGARVALLVAPGEAWLAAAFGAWRQGLVVCTNVQSSLAAAVVDTAGLQRLLTSGHELPGHVYVVAATGPVPPGLDDFEAEAPPAPAVASPSAAPALARDTLGATHAQLLAQLGGLQERLRLRAAARVLAPRSTEAAAWPVAALLLPIAAGATIVFAGAAASDRELAELIRTQSISHAFPDFGLLVELAAAQAQTAAARDAAAQLSSAGSASDVLGGALVGLTGVLAAKLGAEHALVRAASELHGRFARARASTLQALVTTSLDPLLPELMAASGLPVLRGWSPPGALGYVTLQDGAPPRTDSVGRPLRGLEVLDLEPDAAGFGELIIRGPFGELAPGVRGRVDASLHVLLAPAPVAPPEPGATP